MTFRHRALGLATACVIAVSMLGGCDRMRIGDSPIDPLHSRLAMREPTRAALAPRQRAFLTQAAQSSLFEIAASRVALTRGGSAAVRRFAEAMLRDRVAVDTDLAQLAASVGVALPARLSDQSRARLAVLEQLTGSDFDRAYARNVAVIAQEEALTAFERAADAGGERVQRFAAGQVPVLRQHLEQGRRLAYDIDLMNMA